MPDLRIRHADLRQNIMSAEAVAALIHHGEHVGISGFTSANYPNLPNHNSRFTPPDKPPTASPRTSWTF